MQLANQKCWDLILVSRDAAALEQVCMQARGFWRDVAKPPRALAFVADLLIAENRVALEERVRAEGLRIDLLINNAGMGFGIDALGAFEHGEPQFTERVIQLNSIAPLHLSRLFLPHMRAAGEGHIINVCSRRALAPTPYLACYAASKALLLHASIAMAEELRGSGIRILAFCPCPTDTPGHRAHSAGTRSLMPVSGVESVVRQALRALEQGKTLYVAGTLNRLVFGVFRLLPLFLSARIQGWITNATYRVAGKKLG